MLPATLEAYAAATERVREAGLKRDEALVNTAVEAATEYARSWLEALNVALKFEATVRGLAVALMTLGNRTGGCPAALSAAAVVGELVRTTRQTSAVAQDFESGRRLLERLADDPAAALADPSPAKLARLDRAARREMLGVADRIDPPVSRCTLRTSASCASEVMPGLSPRRLSRDALSVHPRRTNREYAGRFENAGRPPEAGSGVSLDVVNGWLSAVPDLPGLRYR